MALHPVQVAFERVDLTIVRQHAERLCQPPLRESVGGIALVIDRKRAFKPLIQQVRIEHRHLLREHHAFVDNRPARQRRQIELTDVRSQRRLFNPTTDHIQLTLKCVLIHTFGVGDQNLLDLRTGCVGFLTQTGHIHRHMAPAIDAIAHLQNFGFHNCPAAFLRAVIGAW